MRERRPTRYENPSHPKIPAIANAPMPIADKNMSATCAPMGPSKLAVRPSRDLPSTSAASNDSSANISATANASTTMP